ncbi:uncharacterized protein [Eucyclogobius newberryi]|uniref:uncharacterized protein n=1 Tax=Eucyclogobius newberryi TaxID=166745 RepID=UPI003B5C3179
MAVLEAVPPSVKEQLKEDADLMSDDEVRFRRHVVHALTQYRTKEDLGTEGVAAVCKGVKLQYTRLPQGFKLSPGVFNQVLKKVLSTLQLPEGVILMQYVDDLLLAAPTVSTCLSATKDVLLWLHECGFKVSQKTLKCCRRSVKFLGRTVSSVGNCISPEHKNMILSHPKPATVVQMLSFLGLCGFSRLFLPDYTLTTASLRALIRDKGMKNNAALLDWTTEVENDFTRLKQMLSSAAALAVPDYSLPFFLDCSVTGPFISGLLYQKKAGSRTVLLYLSASLDSMEARQPPCVAFASAIATLINKCAHLVMNYPLTVLTTHAVVGLVQSTSFTMTALRQRRLLKVLQQPHLSFSAEGVNMADNISCEAQRAEILAIVLALENSADQPVTIYPDSAYAVGVIVTDLAEWRRNDFKTAKGSPVKHLDLITRLDAALVLPSALAVVKCPAHTKGQDFVSRGNEAADCL